MNEEIRVPLKTLSIPFRCLSWSLTFFIQNFNMREFSRSHLLYFMPLLEADKHARVLTNLKLHNGGCA